MKKILIVGGVAGGSTAATRLRRLNENDQIIIFEKDEYISFANCGLPYYIGDVINQRDRLIVESVEGMHDKFNLDIRTQNKVVSINRKENSVSVENLKTGEVYTESFDHLILSPGAKPIVPPIKGLNEADNVFTLRNIPDTDRIKENILKNHPKKALVIGGGFIGIEMAENLHKLGIEVTIVEKLPQVFKQLDFEMAQLVHRELSAHGVSLILGDGVSHFEEKGHKIVLESGLCLEADIVILSIGVRPENELAKDAGLKLSKSGHIVTDRNYSTLDANSDEIISNIHAVGDAVEVFDFIDGSKTSIPLAGPANRQARQLADYINGKEIKNNGVLGTAVAQVFDVNVASTGYNEDKLKQKGIEYRVVHALRANHAGYYPGAVDIQMKLLFDDKTGKIFGAQAIGREGTCKRIDVIATLIRLGGTVHDLADLELCYAPPFSSAKDPVNILGYMAENLMDGITETIQWQDVDGLVKSGEKLIDVRTEIETISGKIENSINIPITDVRKRIAELPEDKDKPVYIYCKRGLTGYIAARIIKAHGYKKVYNLSGGYDIYNIANYKAVKAEVDKTQEVNLPMAEKDISQAIELNVCGLQCPGPLMATYKTMQNMQDGELIKISATDYGFTQDIKAWCATNKHKLISQTSEKGKYVAIIEKGNLSNEASTSAQSQENASLVVFSGDLDKAIAAMIIAQGAAAQGKNVTVFFTFWGLNALRKSISPPVKKNIIEKMFGIMMPKGASKLKISKMNMMGMGTMMIKGIMKQKNVDDIDTMIKKAQEAGVKFIACTMSMELMGIKKEELLDGIEYAGVATYIAANENVGTTLFI